MVMSLRGLLTAARSLPRFLKLVILSAVVLILAVILKKVISRNKGKMVYNYIVSLGISPGLAQFMTAQSAHETAGFTSPLLLSNKNLFGMTYAGQGRANDSQFGFANYNTQEDSIEDYINWFRIKRNKPFSLPLIISDCESFVKFLKNNNYFEDDLKTYTTGVINWHKQLFS
jgi:hypothetical protein